jgi:hypothetical protein
MWQELGCVCVGVAGHDIIDHLDCSEHARPFKGTRDDFRTLLISESSLSISSALT